MNRQKYHLLLFFFSIPFNLMLFKGWWSDFHSNWSSDAYPFLILFGVLAEIYFSKQKLVYAGMGGIGLFILGYLLNILHWPGAQLCVLVGLTLVMIIPLWSAITTSEQKPLRLLISIWILIYGIGVVFRIFHWPAAGLWIVSSMFLIAPLTITLGISLWKANQKRNEHKF